MIVDRMTTLIQKTLDRSLKKINGGFKSQLFGLKKELEMELKDRGLQFTMVDFAAFIEEVSPNGSKAALGFMLNFLRPFSAGMGFRVTRISDSQIEIVIPWKFRNRNDQGHLHEATLLPAAIEAAQIFWQRHLEGPIEIQLLSESSKIHQVMNEDARLRAEIPSGYREFILSQLRENPRQAVEMKFQIYGAQDRLNAEIEIKILVQKTLTLSQKKSNQDHPKSKSEK
jgi:hypothetical protein